ncbi:MAG: heparin lyase I family protein [Allomuricauda sp.]
MLFRFFFKLNLILIAGIMLLSCKDNSLEDSRPTGQVIDKPGNFFDDFDTIPKQDKPNSTKFTYSLHSFYNEQALNLESIDDQNVLKLTLNQGEEHKQAKGYRSELALVGGNPKNEEQWYEWSFMIPEDYTIDEKNMGREVSIAQFHSIRNKKKEPKLFNRPSVQFLYMEQYGKNVLLLRYGWNGQKGAKYENHKWKIIALDDDFIKGKWHKVRINIKWSLTNDGYIAVWLNDKPFTPYNGVNNKVYGANMHNKKQSYLKLGFYRYWDDSNTHDMYFDYVKAARSYFDLTGKRPNANNLYGVKEGYEYLVNKDNVLFDVEERNKRSNGDANSQKAQDHFDFNNFKTIKKITKSNVSVKGNKIIFTEANKNFTDSKPWDRKIENFNYDGTYLLSYKENHYFFKVGSYSYNNNKTHLNRVNWLNKKPENFKGLCEFSLVEVKFNQFGNIRLCTVGDSQTRYARAMHLRRKINKILPEMVFVGNRQDIFGYFHEGEGGNSTKQLLNRANKIPQSDYYTLLIGTNDYKKYTVEESFARIQKVVDILTNKSPNSKVLYITPVPTTNNVRDDFNLRLIDLIKSKFKNNNSVVFVKYGERIRNDSNWPEKYLLKDGLHQNSLGIDLMAKMISQKIDSLEKNDG